MTCLKSELETAREETTRLREALVGDGYRWVRLAVHNRLTRQQEMMLRAFYKRTFLSKETLEAVLSAEYPCEHPYERDHQVIAFLRKRMPTGSIQTLHGRGHLLTPQGKRWIEDELERCSQ